MADVSLNFFGNKESAEKALVSLEKRLDRLEAKTRAAGKSSRAATGGMVSGFANVTKAIGSTTVAAAGLLATLRQVIQAQREIQGSAETTEEKFQKATLKFQQQAGVGGDRATQVRNQALEFAKNTGLSAEGTLAAATEAVSAGANQRDAPGIGEEVASLAAALKKFDATPQEHGDISGAMAGFLNATGENLDRASFRELGQNLTGAISGTKLELADLGHISSKFAKPAADAGLSQREIIAAPALLKQTGFEGATAATASKAVLSRLTAPTTGGLRALDTLGLSPEDVDLQGERFPEALDRVNDALQKVDPKKRARVQKDLFGEEFAGAGLTLAQAADSGAFDDVVGEQMFGVFDRNKQLNAALESPLLATRRLEAKRDYTAIQAAESVDGLTVKEEGLQREIERNQTFAGSQGSTAARALAIGADTLTGAAETIAPGSTINEAKAEDTKNVQVEQLKVLQSIDTSVKGRADRNAQR